MNKKTKMNKTLIVVLVVGLLLVGSVSAVSVLRWSNPTHRDGSVIEYENFPPAPIKTLITKEAYNQIFSDYRSGILTQEEASQKLNGVRIK